MQKALDQVIARPTQTMLVIAHLLSTIRTVHEVVVLRAGKVAERGTFEQLQAAGGFLKNIAES